MTTKSFIISTLFMGLCATTATAQKDATATITGAKKLTITLNPDITKNAIIETATDTLIFTEVIPKHGFTPGIRLTRTGLSLLGNIGEPQAEPTGCASGNSASGSKKQSSINWDLTSGGLGFGFCAGLEAPAAAGLEMGKSFELTWLNILAVVAENRHRNSFSLGIGINWRNYRTTLNNCFTANDGRIDIDPYPEGAQPRLSRIKIFSLQFPLLYTQQIPIPRLTHHNMQLRFGPIFNLNTHASVLTAWRTGNTTSEYKADNINARLFTIDLFASLRFWDGGSVYVRYSPYRALTGPGALNFNQLSTGLLFLM